MNTWISTSGTVLTHCCTALGHYRYRVVHTMSAVALAICECGQQQTTNHIVNNMVRLVEMQSLQFFRQFYNPTTLQKLLLILKVCVVHKLHNYYHLLLFCIIKTCIAGLVLSVTRY